MTTNPGPSRDRPEEPAVWESWSLDLPSWLVEEWRADIDRTYESDGARMRRIVELSRRNVAEGTGGPFGAAIFDGETGRMLAPGVNLVVPARTSMAHAEVVAILLAQQKVGHHDLGAGAGAWRELVCSTEPCAMCLGSVPWSGVRRLVCGATGDDAEAIGFDEGAKPEKWVAHLEQRGIEVVLGIEREAARGVLEDYASRGGVIY